MKPSTLNLTFLFEKPNIALLETHESQAKSAHKGIDKRFYLCLFLSSNLPTQFTKVYRNPAFYYMYVLNWAKWQVFKTGMTIFQLFYKMKLKTSNSKFKALAVKIS